MAAIQIYLTDSTKTIPLGDLIAAGKAFEAQLNGPVRDAWDTPMVEIVVGAPKPWHWTLEIVHEIPDTDFSGLHDTEHGQPYARVEAGPDWTVTASHELIEMVIDPTLCRTLLGPCLGVDDYGNITRRHYDVEYLVEACDPLQGRKGLDGRLASFVIPGFYSRPTVFEGGYISWIDPVNDHLNQIVWPTGGKREHRDIGKVAGSALRKFVEDRTHHLFRRKK